MIAPAGETAAEIRPTWWLCRAREHAWPEQAHAELCCHTHRVTVRYGFGPTTYPGPEPVLPGNGVDPPGPAFCWLLVPPGDAGAPLLNMPPHGVSPTELDEAERAQLGPWYPGKWGDREPVTVAEFDDAIARARRAHGGRKVTPAEAERFVRRRPSVDPGAHP